MRPFLHSLLADQSGKGVIDLCLDHKLIQDIHPEKFTEIDGLDLLPDLKVFSAAMHTIRSLDGLRAAPHLLELDLSLNEISDISGIEWLSHIHRLRLSHNEINDLEGIRGLSSLLELDLGFNQLSDISPLSQLSQLEILILNGNRGLADLAGLPPFLRELHVTQAFVGKWDSLLGSKRLESLSISPGTMKGMAFLTDLPLLQTLKISAGRLHGNIHLPDLPLVQTLRIHKAIQVSGLSGFSENCQLGHLDIGNSLLESPPDLAGCNSLETLEIKFSPLKSLQGIAEIPTLQRLVLTGSSVPTKAISQLQKTRPELAIEI
jgi:Leucine-rich repeat (LRR) protein